MEMEIKRRYLGATLLLFLVLFASNDAKDEEAGVAKGVTVMARTCESQSHRFEGACASNHNCGLVCRNEGFTDGRCRGFRRRCFCTRPC